MKAGSAILIAEFASLGAAYQALQDAAGIAGDAAELLNSNQSSAVIFSGDEKVLSALILNQSQLLAKRLVKSVSQNLIEAFLGFQNPPLEGSFVCFETKRVGDAFEAADRLEKVGLTPFDLRIARGGEQLKATLLAQGSTSQKPALGDLAGTLTMIEKPSALLKSFFEISPQ